MARYTRTFNPKIMHVTTGIEDLTALGTDDASARAFAFRQSEHSFATFDPNEKPLNDLPQFGQLGIGRRISARVSPRGSWSRRNLSQE